MKRLIMLFAAMLMASVVFSQDNLYWTMTVNVKLDKKLEWEKKLTAYTKTHMPQLKYRTYEIISGENTGAYVIVVGPTSYKEMDIPLISPKGEAQMKIDGQGLDALSNSFQVSYLRRQNEISSAKPDRKLKYLLVTYNEITIGSWGEIYGQIKKEKEAADKGGSKMDIDFFRPSASGPGNAFAMVRYVEKLEELDLQENFEEMYDKVFGNNAFYSMNLRYYSLLKSTRSELRVLRSDLSAL